MMKKLLLILLLTMSALFSVSHARDVTIEEKITGLYVAYFNRAGDQEGVNWWKGLGEQAEAEGKSASIVLKELSYNFSQHPSFARAYGDMGNQAFVEAVYSNTLGREGDAAGVAWWTSLLNENMSRSDFVSTFVEAALTFDRNDPQYAGLSEEDLDAAQLRKDLISNKVEVALAFTHQLGDLSNVTNSDNPESDPAYLASIKIISEVTEDYITVERTVIFLAQIEGNENPIDDILEAEHIGIAEVVKHFTVSADEPIIEDEEIRIAFSSYSIEEEGNLTIVQKAWKSIAENEDTDEEKKEQMNTLFLEGQSKFNDPVEMTFPFSEVLSEENGFSENGIVGIYFNPETNESEPADYRVDEENGTITIMSDHFSKYGIEISKNVLKKGPFKVTKDHTRYAKIIDIDPYYKMMGRNQMLEVIGEAFANNMEPGDEAFEASFGAANTWLGIAASGNTLVGASYSSELLQSIGNSFNTVGVLAALVQAGVDYESGDTQALYTNLLKNGVYNTVSLIGTGAMQLAFVGVFAIDYSINAFAQEAWDGNNAKWNAVYGHCYNKHFKQNSVEWYKLFYRIWHDAAYSKTQQSMTQVKARIDQSVLDNVWGVWNMSASELTECIDDLGYTNMGGLNTEIKRSLALAKRAELVSGKLVSVMQRLQRPITYKMREDYRKELKLQKATLNQKVNFEIRETVATGELLKYAGYRVRFTPLNEETDKRMWTGVLHDNGSLNTSFTLLGHLQAGSPRRLEIFKPEDDPDNDAPVKTVDFTVSLPNVIIELGDGFGGGMSTAIQRCPMSQEGDGAIIVDQTSGMIYADLGVDDFYGVLGAIRNHYSYEEQKYFTCSYGPYGSGELYMTSYTDSRSEILREEWFGTNGKERPQRIKYKRDLINSVWTRYDWEWVNSEWVYSITDTGNL